MKNMCFYIKNFTCLSDLFFFMKYYAYTRLSKLNISYKMNLQLTIIDILSISLSY